MTDRLREVLTALADQAPVVPVAPDLYDRARRRHRRIRAVLAVAGTATVAVGTAMIAGMVNAPRTGRSVAEPAAGNPVALVSGPLGAAALLVLLLLGAVLWRHLPGRVRFRRLVVLALAGLAVLVAAPPGLALWGEPAGQPGLPSEVVAPPIWTARATDSPPGAVAMVFGGRDTRNDWDEGRIAMVAGDGDRYRILDPFMYVEPGAAAALSPNGRYLYHEGHLLDLRTGRPAPEVPGVVRAWSGDGRRLVYSDEGQYDDSSGNSIAVWDFAARQDLLRLTVPVESVAYGYGAALSPDGSRLALQVGAELRLYRVGTAQPYRTIPLGKSRLGGTAAWTPDGRGVLVARRETCTTCPVSWYTRQWRLETLDAETGEPVPGAGYAALPSIVRLAVLGWRTPTQPVVQLHDPQPGARDDSDDEPEYAAEVRYTGRVVVFDADGAGIRPLVRLPEGTEDVAIAADFLAFPVRDAGPVTYGPPHLRFIWLLVGVGLLVVIVCGVRRRGGRRGGTRAADGPPDFPPAGIGSHGVPPAGDGSRDVPSASGGSWRRRLHGSAGVALLTWLIVSVGAQIVSAADRDLPQTAASGTIPQQIVRPYPWVGAGNWWHASVVYGGGADTDLYVVDAGSAAQRTIDNLPRVDLLLSPDGSTIVYGGPDQPIRAVDLRDLSGRYEARPDPGMPSGPYRPLAWQPRGEGLVVGVRGADQRWSLWRLNVYLTGWSKAVDLGAEPPLAGRTAFAPDGRDFAVQSGAQVRVVTSDNQVRGPWALPPDARLAGPGAWTPDGLLIAEPDPDAGDPNSRHWRFRLRDPDTGADRGPAALPAVTGGAVKLLGRRASTTYLCVYEVSRTAGPQTDELSFVTRVEVLAVGAGDLVPQRFIDLPDGVDTVEIAADALAHAAVRPGGERPVGPLPGWIWWPALPTVVALLIGWLWWLRAGWTRRVARVVDRLRRRGGAGVTPLGD